MMETADSIKQYGVLVPAIARPDPEGGYELVAGHRGTEPVSWQKRRPCRSLFGIWMMMPPRSLCDVTHRDRELSGIDSGEYRV